MQEHQYQEVTEGVRVVARPKYVAEKSNPKQNYYFFAYNISIENRSAQTLRLTHRHWLITDGNSRTEEVFGPGVVGLNPELKPGESFSYSSACPLSTPTGNMRGHYDMVDTTGRRHRVKIPLFFLRTPESFH